MSAQARPRNERTPLERRFEEHLRASGTLPEGAAIMVALSGGLDSVVLTDLLMSLQGRWAWTLTAGHFDHRTREESGQEADWVRRLCEERNLPLWVGAAQRPPKNEAEARELRYAFLDTAREESGARLLVTAHQADDQAETVLFRMLRGSGLGGLAGIPHRRHPDIVRPLLPFWRNELEDHARRRGLAYLTDSSNLENRFARNRLRNDLIPALENRGYPLLREQLVKLAGLAGRASRAAERAANQGASDLIQDASESRIVVARSGLLAYDTNTRAHLLRTLMARLGTCLGRVGTRVALEFINTGNSGRRIDLVGGIAIRREFDRLIFERRVSRQPVADESLVLPDTGSGVGAVRIAGEVWQVGWSRGDADIGLSDAEQIACFVPSQLHFPLAVRSWRPGDRIRLPTGRRKLKKLFVDKRVGRWDRDKLPLLVDGGEVLWVVGLVKGVHAVSCEADGLLSIRFRRPR